MKNKVWHFFCIGLSISFLVIVSHFFFRKKTDSSTIKIKQNLQQIAQKTDVATPEALPDRLKPEYIARAFRIPSPNVQAASNEKNEPEAVNWLKSIGCITDTNNIEWLYIRNIHTNSILKVRKDGKETNGTQLLRTTATDIYIKINNRIYFYKGTL